mgnify:FL=1
MTPLFTLVADVLAPLATGYVLRRSGKMNQRQCDLLMLANVIVLVTVMNLSSFWLLPLDSRLLLLPTLSVIMTLASGLLAIKFFTRRLSNPLEQGAYINCAMLGNIGTLAGICAFILYGEVSFAYVQLFAVLQNFLLVVCCFPLSQIYRDRYLSEGSAAPIQISIRSLLFTKKQIGVLGMAAGLLLHYLNVPRPDIVTQTFHYMVHIQAWISFTPVGYVISFQGASAYIKKVLTLIPLRILVTIGIFLLATCFTDDMTLLKTLLLSAAAPTAINAVIATRLFKLNVDLAVAGFILTTLVYVLLFFPLFALFLK